MSSVRFYLCENRGCFPPPECDHRKLPEGKNELVRPGKFQCPYGSGRVECEIYRATKANGNGKLRTAYEQKRI